MWKYIVGIALATSGFMLTAGMAKAAPSKIIKFNNLTWTVPELRYDSKLKNWKEAEKHCKDMGARLPTKDELVALNRAGTTPDDWPANVTMTSTPFGTNKHYTVFIGQLDGVGWSSDSVPNIFTCVK